MSRLKSLGFRDFGIVKTTVVDGIEHKWRLMRRDEPFDGMVEHLRKHFTNVIFKEGD